MSKAALLLLLAIAVGAADGVLMASVQFCRMQFSHGVCSSASRGWVLTTVSLVDTDHCSDVVI